MSSAHTPSQDSNQWHPLKYHLFKVANLAKTLGNKFNAGELAYYAGLWHDLGKYNPDFQKYLEQCHEASKSAEKAPDRKVPHAKYGAKLAAEKFQPLAPLIFGHHSGLPKRADLSDRLEEVNPKTYKQILDNAGAESLSLDLTHPEIEQQLINLATDEYSFDDSHR